MTALGVKCGTNYIQGTIQSDEDIFDLSALNDHAVLLAVRYTQHMTWVRRMIQWDAQRLHPI